MASKSYNERAYFVLSKFLSDFTEEELKKCIDSAYTCLLYTSSLAKRMADGETAKEQLEEIGEEIDEDTKKQIDLLIADGEKAKKRCV